MPVSLTYPGVYTQEAPSGLTTISGVSTSTPLFIGMTYRGQLNVPRRCLGFKDYERIFGSDRSTGEMADQVRQFFLNGGSEAWVMRIVNKGTTAAASVTLANEDMVDVIVLTAREQGKVGENLRIVIDYDTAEPETSFNLRVLEMTLVLGKPVYTVREEHKGLTMSAADGRYALNWIKEKSDLLDADPPGGGLPAGIRGYSVAGRLFAGVVDVNADVDSVIPGGPGSLGQIEISVDNGPFVPVGFKKGDPTTVVDAINDALRPYGPARVNVLTIPANADHLVIVQSQAVGGSVRVRRAMSNDIAAALQLGTGSGGVEVNHDAHLRPAPNGLFSSLGNRDLDGGGQLERLTTFLKEDLAHIPQMQVTDTAGGAAVGVGTALPVQGAAADPGLRYAIDALNVLRDKINGAAFALKWRAKRTGHRLVLLPEGGTDDNDPTATLTSAPYDLGGAHGLFELAASTLRYRLAGTVGYATTSTPGNDGSRPLSSDYDDAYEVVKREIEIFNLLVLPRTRDALGDQTDLERDGLWPAASAFCFDRLAFLLVDPHDTWKDYNDALKGADDIRQLGLVNDHSGLFWPRIKITDPVTRLERAIDPSGSLAGLAARIDSSVGVWKAFAGLEANLRGVRRLEYRMSDAENGVINPKAVNALRIFSSGTVCWGARTLDGFDDSGNSDYRYIPVRRLALHIRGSLLRGLGFAVFRPNGEALWAEIRRAAKGFLHNLYRQGAFAGATARDSYQVKCDAETTTETDRRLGIVNVLVMFAPLFPAEFVVITLQQMTQEAQT